MDVSTIIVSYNTFALTREAVRTALAAAAELDHEVVVVDNDSPDGSAARLAEAFAGDDRVMVLATGENAGFAAANNRGAAVARGRVLYFLNPTRSRTATASPGWRPTSTRTPRRAPSGRACSTPTAPTSRASRRWRPSGRY